MDKTSILSAQTQKRLAITAKRCGIIAGFGALMLLISGLMGSKTLSIEQNIQQITQANSNYSSLTAQLTALQSTENKQINGTGQIMNENEFETFMGDEATKNKVTLTYDKAGENSTLDGFARFEVQFETSGGYANLSQTLTDLQNKSGGFQVYGFSLISGKELLWSSRAYQNNGLTWFKTGESSGSAAEDSTKLSITKLFGDSSCSLYLDVAFVSGKGK